MQSHDSFKPVERRSPQVGTSGDPPVQPDADRHTSAGRIDVTATALGHFDRCEKHLSFPFGTEAALVRLAVIGLAIAHAVSAPTACLVRCDATHGTTCSRSYAEGSCDHRRRHACCRGSRMSVGQWRLTTRQNHSFSRRLASLCRQRGELIDDWMGRVHTTGETTWIT